MSGEPSIFYSPYPFDPPDRLNNSVKAEDHVGKDVSNPLVPAVRVFTDLEEEFKIALQDVAAYIIPVHPSVDKNNGWVEEVNVIALRQIARDILERHKIPY